MERWKQKFSDGDGFSFCTDVIDGVVNVPLLKIARLIKGQPKTAVVALMDTDTGEDLVEGLYEALGEYLEEKAEALAAVAEETSKSKGKK
jgi:hypothetical protein